MLISCSLNLFEIVCWFLDYNFHLGATLKQLSFNWRSKRRTSLWLFCICCVFLFCLFCLVFWSRIAPSSPAIFRSSFIRSINLYAVNVQNALVFHLTRIKHRINEWLVSEYQPRREREEKWVRKWSVWYCCWFWCYIQFDSIMIIEVLPHWPML